MKKNFNICDHVFLVAINNRILRSECPFGMKGDKNKETDNLYDCENCKCFKELQKNKDKNIVELKEVEGYKKIKIKEIVKPKKIMKKKLNIYSCDAIYDRDKQIIIDRKTGNKVITKKEKERRQIKYTEIY